MPTIDPKNPVYAGRKFAVVSHVLPPAPSGQSILLDRLLREADEASYCLIHNGQADASSAANGLAGTCHQLRPPLHLPVLEIPVVCWLPLLLNTLLGVFDQARQIARIVRNENCDLLIGCTGDLAVLPATWLASRWTGRPFIAYILDDYLFQWTGFRRRISAWLEPKFIHGASRVFVLNEFVQRCYAERYGVRPEVIHNPVRLPKLDQPTLAKADSGHKKVDIVYTGSIYHAHFDAFQNLVEVLNGLDPERVRLHIYTSQPRKLLHRQGIIGPAVVFHPHIPQEEVFKILQQADILFLPLAFHSSIPEVIQTSAPFKTSEYLAVGRPILVHAPAGSFLSWYFRKNHCGLVVDRDDRKLLKEAVAELLSDASLCNSLAVNARRQAEIDFNIIVIRPAFFELLNQVATSKKS